MADVIAGADRPSLSRPVKVMIVDDSAIIRSLIERTLKADKDIEVCGFASNGEEALKTVSVCNPDVIVLDIEMPVMDGITALPQLLQKKKDAKILICSTLSDRGAEISLKALSLGAADCILKPSGATAIQQNADFNASLLRAVLLIGAGVQAQKKTEREISVRARTFTQTPKILAIGSSTGGPNALMTVLKELKGIRVPVVITQHMPPKFTKILAEHIAKETGLDCVEGAEGMLIKPGCAYVAPGGYHMVLKKADGGALIHLDEGPLENFCKPAVDPMLRSLIQIYGGSIFAVILTGMGHDGLEGCKEVVRAGGQVIAQDAKTSVVWGMPGAVANEGLCSAVLPLPEIGGHIFRVFNPSRPSVSSIKGQGNLS